MLLLSSACDHLFVSLMVYADCPSMIPLPVSLCIPYPPFGPSPCPLLPFEHTSRSQVSHNPMPSSMILIFTSPRGPHAVLLSFAHYALHRFAKLAVDMDEENSWAALTMSILAAIFHGQSGGCVSV